MKQNLLLFLLALQLQTGFSQNPALSASTSFEKVYQLHLKAMGGEAKLNSLNTYSYNAVNENNQSFVITYKKPGLFNSSYNSEKGTSSEFIKGTESWQLNFDGTVNKGINASFVMVDIMKFSLQGFLYDAVRLHYTLNLLTGAAAKESLRIIKTYDHLDVSPAGILIEVESPVTEKVKTIYKVILDPETYMIQFVIGEDTYGMSNINFSDYKTVDGLKVFTKIAFGREGFLNNTKKLSNFKLNGAVKPELFIIPAVTTKIN